MHLQLVEGYKTRSHVVRWRERREFISYYMNTLFNYNNHCLWLYKLNNKLSSPKSRVCRYVQNKHIQISLSYLHLEPLTVRRKCEWNVLLNKVIGNNGYQAQTQGFKCLPVFLFPIVEGGRERFILFSNSTTSGTLNKILREKIQKHVALMGFRLIQFYKILKKIIFVKWCNEWVT